jgi:hypothetical protein
MTTLTLACINHKKYWKLDVKGSFKLINYNKLSYKCALNYPESE